MCCLDVVGQFISVFILNFLYRPDEDQVNLIATLSLFSVKTRSIAMLSHEKLNSFCFIDITSFKVVYN